MRLKVSAGGVPVGSYTAKFAGIEPTTSEQYGAGYRWKWEITAGAQAGQAASRTTGTTPTEKNGCGAMLRGLIGGELAVGQEIDIEQYIGRNYMLVVAATASGATRVEAIVPVNQ